MKNYIIKYFGKDKIFAYSERKENAQYGDVFCLAKRTLSKNKLLKTFSIYAE